MVTRLRVVSWAYPGTELDLHYYLGTEKLGLLLNRWSAKQKYRKNKSGRYGSELRYEYYDGSLIRFYKELAI